MTPIPKGYKLTEVGVIPEDWEVCILSKIAVIQGGIAKNAERNVHDPIKVFYLRVANVQDGYLDLSEMSTLTISKSDLIRYSVYANDILMNEGGDYDQLGRGAVWKGQYSPCIHQNHVFVVRCRNLIIADFLSAYTRSRASKQYFLYAGKQTTNLASISKTSLGELPIVIPPLPEQQIIAHALSDVDALFGALDRLIYKKRDLKQAAMQQLLTGKTRLPGFKEEWKLKRLGDMVTILKGQLITESNAIPGPYPVIAGGKKPAYFHNLANRTGRTITISASGASAGYVAFFNEPIFASDCSTISAANNYSLDFVFFQLQMKQATIYNSQTGGAQPHIHAHDIKPINVFWPPLPEQTAIVAVLSDMDAELSALEKRREKTLSIKQAMMQELLTGRIRLV